MKHTNEHQQQVLFDEPVDSLPDNPAELTGQVVFDEKASVALVTEQQQRDELNRELNDSYEQINDEQLLNSSHKSWLWRTIAVLFAVIVLVEATFFFINGFTSSPIITGIYAALLACLTLVGARALWRELLGLKQFKAQQKVKQQAFELLSQKDAHAEPSTKATVAFCEKINQSLPCDIAFENTPEQQVWQEALAAHHSSAELMQLYSRIVLSKVDEKALNEVSKFSTEAVVLVSLSPIAIIDMLIMLSRNLRMINKIAGLYGLKLGYWSRLRLIKQVFVNMAYAGASEIISDLGTDVLGAELLGKLSTRFAQGLGAGMLTARLGIKTMQLCRPIPFDDKPKLSSVRKKLVSQVKALLNGSVK